MSNAAFIDLDFIRIQAVFFFEVLANGCAVLTD
jgi:hypothetical protein